MKKFLAVLTCFVLLSALLPLSLSAAGVPIDAANFPDPVFREYVQRFDIDKDGTFSDKEISAVKNISLRAIEGKIVTSLEGIKNFARVAEIWCYGNNLSELDLSGMTQLRQVNCSNNNLETLNFSGCALLESFSCEQNRLVTINLTGCYSLMQMQGSFNRLKTLDLSMAPEFHHISLYGNCLAVLNLSGKKIDYGFISPQTVTAQKTEKSGKWTVDIGTLIGKENLGKLISHSGGSLDTVTGILTFDSEPSEFTYTLLTGAAPDLVVKVLLYQGGIPVITANNLSFIQRETAFDLKSEPGLGLHAADPEDGDLTADIQVQVKVMSSSSPESGANAVYDIIPAVNTNKPGRYTVTYTVNDSAGNRVSLDVYVCVRDNPALSSAQSGILVNSEPQVQSNSWGSSSGTPISREEMSAESAVPTPPMGVQDRGTTLVVALMLACAGVVLIISKRRQKAE